MFFFKKWSIAKENAAKAAAISKSQAVIELGIDGTVITANEKFLSILGYTLAEVRGKHHGMFVETDERSGAAYRDFWARLNKGETQSAEYKRIDNHGREVWVQASYIPVLDSRGNPTKVIALASDITAKRIKNLENAGQVSAIERAQGVVEFKLDGTIITANRNFLNAMGFALSEVQGKHDGMFVELSERSGAAYRELWAKLNRGETQSAEYRRFGKGGREVWILATYNPIVDETGKPFKVVAFTTDVTKQKLKAAELEGQVAAIGKSQAVAEFGMDGKILTANDNFLKAFGYSLLNEVQGNHHHMFVEAGERSSAAYREFWAKLNRGESQSAEYQRIGKNGKIVWLQASYNPVLDSRGKPTKVIEVATDITARKLEALENADQLAAIERAQAMAAFKPDGTIIAANDKFLKAMGYTLGDVRGKNDGIFVEASERAGSAYREFWAKLNRGEAQSAEYKRIGKDGKEVWIRASYIPVLDAKGKAIKVIQYATVIESDRGEEMVQEAPVSLADQAEASSLSMERLETRRKSESVGPSPLAQFLTSLRAGFSSAMASSTKAVANFL
ncbi:methyl-accepting chemotaxis protein [Nitrobacter vulgaris]|jgi:methyl-accepting chemotaxis protein|uniref:PAS domain-containing protein n=1 Tax=Nitrobacter vulgaris TaxID=29421 RepID=UPI002858F0A8|nr:PAS domain-containing protein [Nitrobacter vulgaris]MDR6303094.1 methyl-accepting chemotaxis protein [Nitrobacter vulgaris]